MEKELLTVAWSGELNEEQTEKILQEISDWSEETVSQFKKVVDDVSAELNAQMNELKEEQEIEEKSGEEILEEAEEESVGIFRKMASALKEKVKEEFQEDEYPEAEGEYPEAEKVKPDKVVGKIREGEMLTDKEIEYLRTIAEESETDFSGIIEKLDAGEELTEDEEKKVAELLGKAKEYPYPPTEGKKEYPSPAEKAESILENWQKAGHVTRDQKIKLEKMFKTLDPTVEFDMEMDKAFDILGKILKDKTQKAKFKKVSEEKSAVNDILEKIPRNRG